MFLFYFGNKHSAEDSAERRQGPKHGGNEDVCNKGPAGDRKKGLSTVIPEVKEPPGKMYRVEGHAAKDNKVRSRQMCAFILRGQRRMFFISCCLLYFVYFKTPHKYN